MPTAVNRESLTKTIEGRYATQKEGGAFDVKTTLGPPGTSPQVGTTINATSLNGASFQLPNGFEVKVLQRVTQFKDAQSAPSKQLSIYLQGFSNKRYHR